MIQVFITTLIVIAAATYLLYLCIESLSKTKNKSSPQACKGCPVTLRKKTRCK